MPLSKKKMQDMWRGGFCKEVILLCRDTPNNPGGAAQRVHLLSEHIQQAGCVDCGNATYLKNVEFEIAEKMGPDAVQLFFNGGDVTKLPGYTENICASVLKGHERFDSLHSWLAEVVARPPLDLSEFEDEPCN
ncbi:MAG: hypothetical protein CMK74_02175 [Pseudomonadales bacterium]|nr:hypothetical protein [Pseudomonadales bacterium]|tara:strand:- start:583 stop:981 length:399 start_codon:yes stop_codon:yes gene_type:complete